MFALGEKQRARKHDEGVSAIAGHRRESAIEFADSPHLYELKLNGEGPRRRLCRLQHVSGRALAESTGMPKRSDAGDIGQCLLEQAQTLGDELRAEKRQAGDVPPDRVEVPNDIIRGKLATREKPHKEVEGVRRYLRGRDL
jgi:hypothetical protein